MGVALLSLIIILVLDVNGWGRAAVVEPASQSKTSTSEPVIATIPDPTDGEQTNPQNSTSVQAVEAVPILYYHSVMLEAGNPVRMPPDQFEAQMAYLKNNGYHSVTLEQLYKALYKGGALPEKPFVITFDDGYTDNYTTAYPILKKYGYTGTVFMVANWIDGGEFLSLSQLKELAKNGWDIVGHSANHLHLTDQDEVALKNELKGSKELLEQRLGLPVKYFAYPYGEYNEDVVLAVKNAGYLMAFTTERGWADHKTDAFHLHRVYCYGNMGMNIFSERIKNPNYSSN